MDKRNWAFSVRKRDLNQSFYQHADGITFLLQDKELLENTENNRMLFESLRHAKYITNWMHNLRALKIKIKSQNAYENIKINCEAISCLGINIGYDKSLCSENNR